MRLRLDGTVTAVSYSDLQDVFSRVHKTGTEIIIVDMAGVIFMQAEVARKIAQLRSEQFRIINCSPFIVTLLQAMAAQNDRL
jgi:anti-anti-sigma regulatory factor